MNIDEQFSIEILYKEKEYSFEARLATIGYTHKFYVVINNIEVIYEPDEERIYRAVLKEPGKDLIKNIDTGIIKAVGLKIELIHLGYSGNKHC